MTKVFLRDKKVQPKCGEKIEEKAENNALATKDKCKLLYAREIKAEKLKQNMSFN